MTETPTAPPPTGTPTEMHVIQGEKPYKLRELTAGDERTVGAMVAKVVGDPRITNALASGEQVVIIASVISVLLERASHDVALLCASLIGEDKNVAPMKEYRKRDREEQAERGYLRNENEIRFERELDIIERMDAYPSGTYLDIVTDVMEAPSFERFLTSSSRLGTAAMKVSERFRSPSKNGSD